MKYVLFKTDNRVYRIPSHLTEDHFFDRMEIEEEEANKFEPVSTYQLNEMLYVNYQHKETKEMFSIIVDLYKRTV